MKTDPALLAAVRRRRCFWCRKPPPSQAAHVLTKGMGGWQRLDIPENVVPLCCEDHIAHHAGHRPTKDDMLAFLATERQTTPEAILEYLWGILRGEPVRPATDTDDPLGG